MIPMGDYFAYHNAGQSFKQMEDLLQFITENYKNNSNIKYRFSTPSEYIKAVRDEKLPYDVYTEDLFPIAKATNEIWTGYFTSKPAFKKQIKDSSSLMHAHSKLFAQKVLQRDSDNEEIT